MIDAPPPPTTPIYPSDGEDPVSVLVNLRWERLYEASGYRFSLWKEDPIEYVEDDTDLENVFNYAVTEALESDTPYFWKVVPYNAFGDAVNCPTWSFITAEAGLVPIGEGDQNLQLPINAYQNYSYTQNIYYQHEINVSNQRIEKISYHWNGMGDGANCKEWEIYMGHTSQETYGGVLTWIPTSELTQVFSGEVPLTGEAGWMEITLQRPFLYNNEDHLVVAVNEIGPGSANTTSQFFYCTPTPLVRRSCKIWEHGSPISATNLPSSGIGTDGFANIQLKFNPIPSEPELALDMQRIDFGNVPQNRWFGPVNLKVTNVGQRTLHINSNEILISGPHAESFQFSTVNLPVALEMNESVIIPLYVNATHEGRHEAILTFRQEGITYSATLVANGNEIGVAIVGTDTAQSEFPFYTDFLVEAARTQMLFTADELMQNGAVAGEMNRIGWEVTDWGDGVMENFSIGIKTVPYTTTSIYEFSEGGFTTYYTEDELEIWDLGWYHFDFDTPFIWNGVDNVIVEVSFENEYEECWMAYSVYATNAPGKTVVYAVDDFGMFDEDGETRSLRPNTSFTFTPSSESAVFNITPNVSNWGFGMVLVAQEYTKSFRVSNSGASDLIFDGISISGQFFSEDSPFDSSPIPPSGYRDFTVKFYPTEAGGPYNGSLVFSLVGENISISLSGTAYLPTALPFCEDWENGTGNWVFIDENQTNAWYRGSANPHLGDYSVYISYDGGGTNVYNINEPSLSHIYRDFMFDADHMEFPLTFWWKNFGEANQDLLQAYLVDISYVPEAGVEIDPAYRIGLEYYGLNSTWNEAAITLPGSLSGSIKRLVFSWKNNGTLGSQPPANLDDICIDKVPLPTGPVATPILISPENGQIDMPQYGFEYHFAWNTDGIEPDTYTLYIVKEDELGGGYNENDFFSIASYFEDITSPYVPAYQYEYDSRYLWTVYVYNEATESEAYQWPPFEFITGSDNSINTFPWYEDFESAVSGIFPPEGWTIYDVDGGGSQWGAVGNYNHTPGGQAGAYHAWSSPGYTEIGWLVTPPFRLGDDEWQLDFWNINMYPQDYEYNGVWITSGIPNPDIGPWVELWNPQVATDIWHQESIDLSPYAGQTIHLAFVYHATYAHAWIVDDISIRSLSTDNIPPIIGHLPMLGTPRADTDYLVQARIVDDSFWNSLIGGANLYYSLDNGNSWSDALIMIESSENIFEANIPAQPHETLITYRIEAWDVFNNLAQTDEYVFEVNDPVWIYYDYGEDYQGYMPANIAPATWGAFNMFENPFYGTGVPLYLYATEAATFNPVNGAHLNVYLWNGDETSNPLGRTYFDTPVSINFRGVEIGGWDIFSFEDYNDGEPLAIYDPYFAIAFENLPDTGMQSTNSYFVFDRSYHYGMYGMTLSSNPQTWYTFTDVGGSWSIAAYAGAGPFTAPVSPQLNIALQDGAVNLSWEAVYGANSYTVYATLDPTLPLPWEPIAENISDMQYNYDGTENYQFFYVVADTDMAVIGTRNLSSSIETLKTLKLNANTKIMVKDQSLIKTGDHPFKMKPLNRN